MSKIKSNPVVFSFKEFKNLSNKNFTSIFLSKEVVDWNFIKHLLDKLPQISFNYRGKTMEEKIFNIFLSKFFLFGPKNYILDNKEYWLNKIKIFTEKNERLKLTILGFPFKVPLILKTTRICPDMGDVLVLNQLNNLVKIIKDIYSPGAEIYIITEGCFGKFNQITRQNVIKYQKFLKLMIKELNFDKFLKIIPLDKLEKYPDFNIVYKKNIKFFKELYKKGDKDFLKKYNLAYPSIYHILNPKTKNIELLMDVYNKRLKIVNKNVKKIRDYLNEKIHESIIKYFSFLKTKDDLNFLENEVKNALQLSVSPKPKRLGLLPINDRIDILPHHGVTVYNNKKNCFDIKYYIDILRNNKKYKPIYLKRDLDNQAFFYLEI